MTVPPLEEKPVPLWQKLTAAGYVVVVAVCVWVFRDRLHADFVPLDGSRVAPNILATVVQIVAYTPLAVLVWPPTRRRIHRWMASHTAPLHDHLEEVHRKLDHIVANSPDIPPLPPKEAP